MILHTAGASGDVEVRGDITRYFPTQRSKNPLPPLEDIIYEGEFDWGELAGKVAVGIVIVVVVASGGYVILGAVGVAGAGGIAITAGVVGGTSVLVLAGGDIQRGAISGWEAYLTTAFVGTTISLVTGAMGNVLHGSGLVANVLGGFASGFLSSAAGQYVDIVQKGTGEIDWGQAIKSGLFSSAIQTGSWMIRNADKVKDTVKGLTGKAAEGSGESWILQPLKMES